MTLTTTEEETVAGKKQSEQQQPDAGSSVKDDELYERLRDEGSSKEKAARIANAAANSSRSQVGRKGGNREQYEEWTVDQLRDRARELDVDGRSRMSKDELVEALRRH